ncbi:MAG: TlpA disulfide reductase family protein [Terracidiphilus sp.]|jgi:thiol-disulfide isomerase/thioredoxin
MEAHPPDHIIVIIMKRLFLCACIALCAHFAYSQSEPIVAVDNIAVTHEHKGWRVISASTVPVHFNLIKGDLIVRIDGKNAAETGPMLVAGLFNAGYRRNVDLFIERGGLRMETELREIRTQDYSPVGSNPFRHVASGFSAPDAEFSDIDNQPLTLEQFKGKWLLIDFMGTWCTPCMETLPKVLKSADQDKVNLLIVALRDKVQAVRHMRQSYDIGSPIAMMDPMGQLPIDFGIATNLWTGQIPGLVLIRPDGEVALISIGAVDADHIEKTIDCLIGCRANEDLK